MQKKIIALAIASALTAPALAAAAEATVYGQANLSIDMVSDGMASSTRTNKLVSNQSRVGVKGSEDLGGGTSAVWQLEADVAVDTGNAGGTTTGGTTTSQFFSRNTYLGLSNANMGTLLAGRYDTAYKMATRRLDVFADTQAADNRGLAGIPMMGSLGGAATLDTRVSNSINYLSPSMSGFSVAADTVFGAETATAAVGNSKKGTAYSLAGMYEQGPLYGTFAYSSLKFGDAGTGDLAAGSVTPLGTTAVDDTLKAWKVGVGYAMDAITVNAVIEKPKYTPAAGGGDKSATNYYLAGKFAVSTTDAVKLAYTKRGDTSGATNNAKQYALGYDHNLSSNTMVYALYTKITDNGTVGLVGNPDPSTLSVGMKHMF